MTGAATTRDPYRLLALVTSRILVPAIVSACTFALGYAYTARHAEAVGAPAPARSAPRRRRPRLVREGDSLGDDARGQAPGEGTRRVGGLCTQVAGHAAQLTAKDTALAAKDETIAELRRQRDEDRERERQAQDEQRELLAELRRRADVAEAEAEGLRLRLAEVSGPPVVVVAGQEAAEVAYATTTTPEAQRPGQGLWRRLRRRLGGW